MNYLNSADTLCVRAGARLRTLTSTSTTSQMQCTLSQVGWQSLDSSACSRRSSKSLGWQSFLHWRGSGSYTAFEVRRGWARAYFPFSQPSETRLFFSCSWAFASLRQFTHITTCRWDRIRHQPMQQCCRWCVWACLGTLTFSSSKAWTQSTDKQPTICRNWNLLTRILGRTTFGFTCSFTLWGLASPCCSWMCSLGFWVPTTSFTKTKALFSFSEHEWKFLWNCKLDLLEISSTIAFPFWIFMMALRTRWAVAEEVCLFVECIDIIISDKTSLQVSEPCGAGFESFDFCMFTQHIHWVSVVWHILPVHRPELYTFMCAWLFWIQEACRCFAVQNFLCCTKGDSWQRRPISAEGSEDTHGRDARLLRS